MITLDRSQLVVIVDTVMCFRRRKVQFLPGARNRILFGLQARRFRSDEHLCREIGRATAREETGAYWGWQEDRRPA